MSVASGAEQKNKNKEKFLIKRQSDISKSDTLSNHNLISLKVHIPFSRAYPNVFHG